MVSVVPHLHRVSVDSYSSHSVSVVIVGGGAPMEDEAAQTDGRICRALEEEVGGGEDLHLAVPRCEA